MKDRVAAITRRALLVTTGLTGIAFLLLAGVTAQRIATAAEDIRCRVTAIGGWDCSAFSAFTEVKEVSVITLALAAVCVAASVAWVAWQARRTSKLIGQRDA